MARYLTPSKIGLLALVELYVSETVPSEATLPVLSFITSNLTDRDTTVAHFEESSRWQKAERTFNLVIGIQDFEKLLGSYPFLLGIPGRKLWDQFLGKLWDISSLDALHAFIGNLSSLLVNTQAPVQEQAAGVSSAKKDFKLSKTSLLGSFIRRAQIELGRLRWHDTVELWKDFVRYRQPTANYLRRRFPSFSRFSFDDVLMTGEQDDWGTDGVSALTSVVYGDMLTGDGTNSLPVSTDDVESLLEFQIEQLQKFGGRVPLEIRHQFSDLLRDSFLIPSLTHYLHYLEAWRAGDYPTAFDLLYRYFDYTMQTRDRLFYQYALMNLAILQADFGCLKESITAMLEAVSTARENRDLTCLNFALNWLYQFGRANPQPIQDLDAKGVLGTGKESLAFLRVKAKEMGMWTLWSSVLLSEAKMALSNGDSVATGLEFIVRASQVLVERNMKNMFGSQLALTGAVWDRLGIAQLSTQSCRIFLRCHAQFSNIEEELKTTCRLSFALAGRGRYEEALRIMSQFDKTVLRSSKPYQIWHRYHGLIKLQRDIRHHNCAEADQLLHQLLQARQEDMEPDFRFQLHLMHLKHLTRMKDLQTAFLKLESLETELTSSNNDMTVKVSSMLQKLDLMDKAGRPQRGLSLAIKAANVAWQARLIPLLWESAGAIASIIISLGEFTAAIRLLVAVIPRALECELPELVGQLFSQLADAHMGLAGRAGAKTARRAEYMTAALQAIGKAFDQYSALEDYMLQREMMAKKAMIMKLTGDMVTAANYAAAYVNLKTLTEDRGSIAS